MKTLKNKIWILLTFSLAIMVAFSSCESNEPGVNNGENGDKYPNGETPIIEVTDISLNISTLTLVIGESDTYTLIAIVTPDNATDKTVTWTSNNNDVATVANGVVTVVSAGTATITAQAGNQTDTAAIRVINNGILIGNTIWATRNVDAPGTFVANPEDAGMLYQWNRSTGWSSTNPLLNSNGGTTWDSSNPAGSTPWASANNPCPPGWRVPTMDELLALRNSTNRTATQNGVNGRLWGTAPDELFLPAAGIRDDRDGSLRYQGTDGFYWGSVPFGSLQAWQLWFRSGYQAVVNFQEMRASGLSVRCVASN